VKHKSAALYFEIHRGSSKPCGYIRNSYRKDGKVCHDTLARINGIPLEKLQAMKDAFNGRSHSLQDIKLTDGREYGASAMLYKLAQDIGLGKLIYSRKEEWVGSVMAMIIGRILYAGSKLKLSRTPKFSCLWELCTGHSTRENVDVNKCYDAMDELLKRQDLIQKKLATKHLSDNSIILYDITSSYFEGEHVDSDLVAYGYNRDKKRGKKQIVIGLICTNEGCPISVEVFKGNTNDASTVNGKIQEIKDKFGVTNMIFVGDRGMLTQSNLDSNTNISSITALTHASMKKLCETQFVQLELFDETVTTEVTLPEEPNIRYGLRKNPVRAESERTTRKAIIKITEEKLNEIAVPKRKTTIEKLGARAGKIFAKYGTEKYFSWQVVDGKLKHSHRLEVIADEEKYDGLYVIRTNVSEQEMSISEAVNTYKNLIHVEQAFRNLKTTQLEIRPIYHHNDERIKAHVFLCMLSYYLLWHMQKRLKPLYEADNRLTIDELIETMKVQQKCTVTVGEVKSEHIVEPSAYQSQILELIR